MHFVGDGKQGWKPSSLQLAASVAMRRQRTLQSRFLHALNMSPPVPETLLEKPQISGTENEG
jgi:hypothetical protein